MLDDAAREVFLDMITAVRGFVTAKGENGVDAMHNGRFARNVIEDAEQIRDSRLVAQKREGRPVTVEDMKTLTAADVEAAVRAVCRRKKEMNGLAL